MDYGSAERKRLSTDCLSFLWNKIFTKTFSTFNKDPVFLYLHCLKPSIENISDIGISSLPDRNSTGFQTASTRKTFLYFKIIFKMFQSLPIEISLDEKLIFDDRS